MKKTLVISILAIIIGSMACGGSKTPTATNSTPNSTGKTIASENKSTETTATATAGEASSVVKEIYENAMKRNCSVIPPMLTEEFRKAVGTSKDELDALCDSITDSGKLTSYEIKGETTNGDSGKVKVAQTFKDGKKEEKEENVKKVGGKWLMDS